MSSFTCFNYVSDKTNSDKAAKGPLLVEFITMLFGLIKRFEAAAGSRLD
jgi:hypothetical protein